MYGTYETVDGRPALRFERRLAHPVDAVWRAVTEPSELAHWFPSEVAVDELRPGARMTFTFTEHEIPPMDGEVIELDPPRRFVFTWGGDQLRIELEPADGGAACLLHFTVLIDEDNKAARDASGWHVCLERLAQLLDGTPETAPGTGVTEPWRELYDEYARRGLPTGAEIPG